MGSLKDLVQNTEDFPFTQEDVNRLKVNKLWMHIAQNLMPDYTPPVTAKLKIIFWYILLLAPTCMTMCATCLLAKFLHYVSHDVSTVQASSLQL